jgi:hypothetical protein
VPLCLIYQQLLDTQTKRVCTIRGFLPPNFRDERVTHYVVNDGVSTSYVEVGEVGEGKRFLPLEDHLKEREHVRVEHKGMDWAEEFGEDEASR